MHIILKENSNIGNLDAENDDSFLKENFICTSEYEELKDFSNNKMILLGRTGSGKTALVKKIEEDSDSYIIIQPSKFALEYITNVPVVAKLKSEGVNLEVFYKFLWLHEIISKIILKHLDEKEQRTPQNVLGKTKIILKDLDEKEHSESSLIHFFTELIPKSKTKDLKQMQDYLKKYDGIWFQDDFTGKYTSELEQRFKAEGKIPFLSGVGGTGSLSQKEKTELELATTKYVNDDQIKNLNLIVNCLKVFFERNSQKKVVVVIDDLDQDWIDEDSKYKLIDSLLTSIRSFLDVKNLKIVIALRADLLYKTFTETKKQNEKYDSYTIKLDWNREKIKELLNKRTTSLFKYKYKKTQQVTFEDIFNFNINEQKAFDYILDRTMMRPRDAIDFVNLCFAKASEFGSEVQSIHILEAEEEFLFSRLKALKDEWVNLYPEIEGYITAIRPLGNSFSFEEVLPKYQDIEDTILNTNNMEDPVVIDFSEHSLTKDKKIKNFLKILFRIGIIGKVSINRVVYSTTKLPDLTDLDFNNNLKLVIHPLFQNK